MTVPFNWMSQEEYADYLKVSDILEKIYQAMTDKNPEEFRRLSSELIKITK